MLSEISTGLDVVAMGLTLLFILKIIFNVHRQDPRQDGLFRSQKRSLLHQQVKPRAVAY